MEIGTEEQIQDEHGTHACGKTSFKLSDERAKGRGNAQIGGECREFSGDAGVSDARMSVMGWVGVGLGSGWGRLESGSSRARVGSARVGSSRLEISDIVSVMVEPRERGSYSAQRCTSAVDAAPRFLP